MARVRVHDEQPPATIEHLPAAPAVRQTFRVTAIAQDPSVKTPDGRILTAQFDIPAEHLEPGPRGARFQVIDYDSDEGKLHRPAIFHLEDGDPFKHPTNDELRDSARFRALNVYVIAARTLATFENALGRRLEWASSDHQLNLVPRAFAEANAFYAPEDGAVYFGFQQGDRGEIQTALSHDIVAHEVSHAVLDGLRPRFNEPGFPDQPGFHEALGDIVALLSVFSVQEVVEKLLGKADDAGRMPADSDLLKALQVSALTGLAEELGVPGERGGALRRSARLDPSRRYLGRPEFQEPHRRGEVVVAAVMQTLLAIWRGRLAPFMDDDRKPKVGPSRVRVAEEGAKAAGQLLRMVIRGIDYMPPVDIEFCDVIEAIHKSDEVVAPDDQRHYRETLETMFRLYGIDRPKGAERIADVSALPLVYERSNYASLRSSLDEVFRFLWDNAHLLGVNRRWHTEITSVRPSVRIGPDGLIVAEVVASYTQTVDLTAAELPDLPRGLAFEPPEDIKKTTKVRLWGGGVLVFDQFGRAKYHVRKPLDDGARQRRRLHYLVANGLSDDEGRYGFTLSQARGQRFAELHVSTDRGGERW